MTPDLQSSRLEQLTAHLRETALLESIQSLLEWDERTCLPPAAAEHRADQVTTIAGLVHQRQTDPRLGDWLDELTESSWASQPHSDAGAVIWQTKRQYEKRKKVPQSLVEELARTAVLGQQVWDEARKNDDFAAFEPLLAKTIELKRQQAAAIGFEQSPYDPLLDDFEPGQTTERVAQVLTGLREQLTPLLAEVVQSDRRPDPSMLSRQFSVAAQNQFAQRAAQTIGFDFSRGRLDNTAHPFCAGMGPHDCRITTRYDEHYFPSAFFGTLHESGHGIYDQGLRVEQYGLPPGSAASLGIHESQSRLWENFVGRSLAFWRHFLPLAKQAFPAALVGVSLEDFYFAINDVRPSLIRVDADEATYNLHIIVRFELERALLAGDLSTTDLPSAWKEKYHEYVGIAPDNDANGVLQDIHWSAGLFGYFPTYALGNLYAAQFFRSASQQLDGLAGQIAKGEFEPLRDWLQENIHRRGLCYTAAELVQVVTGAPLSHQSLVEHLWAKIGPLYGLADKPPG